MKNSSRASTVYRKYDDERSVSMSILPQRTRKLRMRKALLLLLYAAFLAGWAVLLAVLQTYAAYIGAFSLLSLLVLVFFTWRYSAVEYEISIHEGCLTFAVIYGGLTRRELFGCAVRELSEIGKVGDGRMEQSDTRLVLTAVSGKGAEPVFYALHRSADGAETLLIFDTTEKLRRLLKYYGGAHCLA